MAGNDAGTAAGSTASGAGPTGDQPDYKKLYEDTLSKLNTVQADAAEYRQRHSGLQGKYQQEQEKWMKDVDALFKTQEQLKATAGEREALEIKAKTLEATLAEREAALAKATAANARRDLVAAKFPGLLPLEAEGLLPDGQGDELVAKLTKLAEKMSAKGQEAIQDFRKGEAPPPPKDSVAATSAALFQQAYSAQKAGKIEDYDRLYDAALKLKAEGK